MSFRATTTRPPARLEFPAADGDYAYPVQASDNDAFAEMTVREPPVTDVGHGRHWKPKMFDMKGISMFAREGIAVSAWVNLDSSCSVEPDVVGDELQIEFGSPPGSLRLAIEEDMVDRLAEIFTDAQARFRKLDEEAEREH